jgi:serine/threonine-protein kinase
MTQFERIGRFQVLDRIGGDAFSLLYSGNDPFEDRPVEIRVCVASDDEFRWRFLKAAEDTFFLRHRNISRVLEFGSGEPKPYVVQEVFPGCSLKERIYSEEPVEDVVKLFYLLQIGQGLEYAHDHGVLHKQISLDVVRVGEGERIKLCEFGVAQLASSWLQAQ